MPSLASATDAEKDNNTFGRGWGSFLGQRSKGTDSPEEFENSKSKPTKWSMGVMNDRQTHEVPGTVLLLSGSDRNEPLGLRNIHATTSHSSLPTQFPSSAPARPSTVRRHSEGKKKTKDGTIILEPQPDESQNDPLNWPAWKRDTALLSLGLYCMIGGGLTPILAAGYTNVAKTYDTTQPKVALTTGLYMMGLGVGSVVASPTAILYGKRPVYMFGALLLIGTSAWCAASPSYNSLLVARIFQGMAVSPVECLPSATIAEIFFLHERAYRIGIYTLLLLGGKNLIPLVSAAIIQSYGWRWVFWIVAIVVGLCFVMLFLFVPETFWDRTPTRSKSRRSSLSKKPSMISMFNNFKSSHSPKAAAANSELALPYTNAHSHTPHATDGTLDDNTSLRRLAAANASRRNSDLNANRRNLHVGFTPDADESKPDEPHEEFGTPRTSISPEIEDTLPTDTSATDPGNYPENKAEHNAEESPSETKSEPDSKSRPGNLGNHSFNDASPATTSPLSCLARHKFSERIEPSGLGPPTPGLHNFNSPFYTGIERTDSDYMSRGLEPAAPVRHNVEHMGIPIPVSPECLESMSPVQTQPVPYTAALKESPRKSFIQQLKPWNGRLHHDNWFRVAIRPFILFAYPAVLWSSIVYACSVGWLIVLSESVSTVYRSRATYNFSALSTGLIYISPFIGGILGTGVAGKVSDIIVRAMTRRNGGLYEPEFRLVMAIPVAITTVIGLMGFGWSAQERDAWIVPTIFFGLISFGCSLGSTTAITFVVDSYRQYAGEALVTLNFSKNIFHGLIFSLFFTSWLEADGSRKVFLALGGIQLALLTLSIPMYIFGKRARMWTVRMNLMEKF